MSNLFKTLKEIIKKTKVNSSILNRSEELYLAGSTDLVDLERRQKEIDSRFIRKL